MNLTLIGVNFRTAPLEVREKMSFKPAEIPSLHCARETAADGDAGEQHNPALKNSRRFAAVPARVLNGTAAWEHPVQIGVERIDRQSPRLLGERV